MPDDVVVSTATELAIDPFAETFLADPIPHRERLRETGRVV
jgi:hypothetical protein